MAEAKAAPKKSRKTLRKEGRNKRRVKLQNNPEAHKAYHEAKSKRSTDKKAAYKKKKKGKK